MIASGMDGWSRGDYETGISLGYDLRDFLPLGRSAFELGGDTLEIWCREWMGDDFSPPLTPTQWFDEGHEEGIHLWSPPPAAALVALKELSKSKHKWSGRLSLGNYKCVGKKWWKLEAPCLLCPKLVTYRSGVICANFGATRGRFRACRSAWCADCFGPHPLDRFEVKLPRDFYGASLAEVEDEVRFRSARPGDHLCTPFQCTNCHCQNIKGRNLVPKAPEDEAFASLVIRATLDAFWLHSTQTVKGHVSEVRFMEKYANTLEICPFPRLGPFPLGHHLGMLTAIMVVMRSMEKGIRKDTVQYGTARKIRGTLTVLWNSSPESGSDITFSAASVKGRYVATCNPAEGRWYSYFNAGILARMGDVVRQDRAFTLEVIHKLLEMYEIEWREQEYSMPLEVIGACMFLLVSSLGGMRGFEVVWTDLAALRYDLKYCETMEDESAVSWPIVGRFKAQQGRLDNYMIPIAGTTNSGIRFFKWTQRFVGILQDHGIQDGWAFRRTDGSRAVAADYRDDIFRCLKIIQSTTTLIDPECDIWEDYGVQRSGRRFLTTHALNMGVSPIDIELQCRWATDRAKGKRTVKRSMVHTYVEVRNMRAALIRPSQAC
ncbi:hypothetical protein ACHAXS_006627 [Conticribra weissflogii]